MFKYVLHKEFTSIYCKFCHSKDALWLCDIDFDTHTKSWYVCWSTGNKFLRKARHQYVPLV
jgi:hypothetical protein